MRIGFISQIALTLALLFTSLIANDRNISIEENIAGLYVAYFNRAPDKNGLEYWKSKGEDASNSGKGVSDVLNELSSGFASHPTFISTYNGLNNREFVEAIYKNVLGKEGDSEGIDYWTKYIDDGKSRSDMVSEFVQISLSTVLIKENYPNLSYEELQIAQERQDLITNKVEVSLNFVNILGDKTNVLDSQNPEDEPAYKASIKILEGITSDHKTVEDAINFLNKVKELNNPIEVINSGRVISTPTPTPVPTPTITPTSTPTATPVPTPTPIITSTPTPTPIPTVIVTPSPTPIPSGSYGFNIGEVSGNTVLYGSIAEFDISLTNKPSADVIIPISSSDELQGIVTISSITFTPDNWDKPQTVIVKGVNSEVDKAQNYKIILAPAQSADSNYNGLDPNDVEIKGIYLKINGLMESPSFISDMEKSIDINISYTGNNRLSYLLVEKPDGMNINSDTGTIVWTAPKSAEGNSYSVKVQVTDGNLSDDYNFSANVIMTTPIQTLTNGNVVSVTEENSNLNGLTITILNSSDNGNLNIPIEKIDDSVLGEIPNFITKITDAFVIKEAISGDIRVRLPLKSLPAGTDLNYVGLYSLVSAEGVDEKFWSSVSTRTDISNISGEPIVEISLPRLEGIFFVGVENSELSTSSTQKIFNSKVLAKTNISSVNCQPTKNSDGSLNYMIQNCKISNNDKINIRVERFGTSATSTRWNGTTIQELIAWLVDAQDGFDSLNLDYDNNFTVKIESMKYLGYVTTGNSENRGTLHITSKNKLKDKIQGTAVHEYFHHAQSRSKIDGRDLLVDIRDYKKWFIEGTARWFEDYLYDDLNTYTLKEGAGYRILEKGLNSLYEKTTIETRPYQRFSFIKLLSTKCEDFESIFRELLNVDKSTDPSGINNLINKLAVADCNFGDQLGANRSSSLESALLYYQYATLYKNQISLLDYNEDDSKFSFQPTIYEYNRADDWNDIGGGIKTINIAQITEIPAYGSYSIKIDQNLWSAIEDGKEAVFRVRTQNANYPLTVSILTEDSSFIGNSELDGVQNKYYQTDNMTEYIFDSSELVDYFITIVNDNNISVPIDEITFEARDKLTQGHLLFDFPIEGLEYFCNDGRSGITDKNGTFECVEAPIVFKVGTLTLGTLNKFTSSQDELIAEAKNTYNSEQLKLLARLTVSLDNDGNVSERITISEDTRNGITTPQDFKDMTIGDIESILNGVGKSLIDECTALKVFNYTTVACNESKYFITTWKTDNSGLTGDNQIGIPTNPNYSYNYTIDWGDGNIDKDVTGDINHTYVSAGIYRVKIDGEFPSIYFYEGYNGNDNNMNSDKRKLLSIEHWGDIQWKSMRGAFAGCQNMSLKASDTPNLSQVEDMSLTFLYASSFIGTGMSNWDVSNVTKMYGTFNGAKSFNGNIENWDVSNVTDMTAMLRDTSSFSNHDLSGWSVENVQNHTNFSKGWGSGNIEPKWKN